MAVKPANSRYHTFTFNGVRAADYGIYVTDVNVFNSAARDVEYIQIPGRDGAFALDRGRFQNISVVYKCAMTQDTDEDFATAISEFRNAIASTKGYKRLEDDIHTDEYRMGVFSKGLEAPTLNTKTATFDVEFNCQPQRFLKSGETAVTIGGDVTNTKTETGSIVTIEGTGADKVTSLVAQITPKQAGSGDPSPSNVRPITGTSTANVFVTGFNQWDEEWEVGALSATGGNATSSTEIRSKNYIPVVGGQTYYLYCAVPSTFNYRFYDADKNFISGAYIGRNNTLLIPDDARYMRFFMGAAYGATYNHDISINYPSTDTEYHPYTGTTTPVPLGQTVYGGEVNPISGELKITHAMWSGTIADMTAQGTTSGYTRFQKYPAFPASTSPSSSNGKISNIAKYDWSDAYTSTHWYNNNYGTVILYAPADIATSTAVQFVCEMATPTTVQLTPTQVATLLGTNNVWADTGDITLTYGRDPNKIVNPTLFESHPLLHLWGYGSIGINGDQLSINNDQYGKILLVDKTKHETRGLSKYIYRNSDHPNPKVSLMNEGDTLTLVRGSFISVQLYGVPVVRFTNVSVSVGGGISASVPSGATQIKNILLTFPEYTFSFGTTKAETIPMTITAAYTYEGAQRTATVTGDIRVVYNVGSYYQSVSIAIPNITNTKPDDFSVSPNADKNGTLQAIYGYSTKRPFAEDADFYFDLDIGEAYKIEDGQTVSVNNAVTIPAKLPTLKSGANTITYDNTITQFKIVPRWWEV